MLAEVIIDASWRHLGREEGLRGEGPPRSVIEYYLISSKPHWTLACGSNVDPAAMQKTAHVSTGVMKDNFSDADYMGIHESAYLV